MLEEHGRRGIGLERQHAARRAFGETERLRDARHLRTDDLLPAQHESLFDETGAFETGTRELLRVVANRGRAAPAGRRAGFRCVLFVAFCHAEDQTEVRTTRTRKLADILATTLPCVFGASA